MSPEIAEEQTHLPSVKHYLSKRRPRERRKEIQYLCAVRTKEEQVGVVLFWTELPGFIARQATAFTGGGHADLLFFQETGDQVSHRTVRNVTPSFHSERLCCETPPKCRD